MPRVFDPYQQGAVLSWSSGLFERVPQVAQPAVLEPPASLAGLDVIELHSIEQIAAAMVQPAQQQTQRGRA